MAPGSALAGMLTRRKKLSPMSVDSQFQKTALYPANLDRCQRCGYPRKLHGDDGSCGLTLSLGSRYLALLIAACGVLSGAVSVLISGRTIPVGSVLAFAGLVAVIFLVSVIAIPGPRS
jgi:hypothetical protein